MLFGELNEMKPVRRGYVPQPRGLENALPIKAHLQGLWELLLGTLLHRGETDLHPAHHHHLRAQGPTGDWNLDMGTSVVMAEHFFCPLKPEL